MTELEGKIKAFHRDQLNKISKLLRVETDILTKDYISQMDDLVLINCLLCLRWRSRDFIDLPEFEWSKNLVEQCFGDQTLKPIECHINSIRITDLRSFHAKWFNMRTPSDDSREKLTEEILRPLYPKNVL